MYAMLTVKEFRYGRNNKVKVHIRLLESETAVRPFIDILNRLEKLGVLTSVEDWQYFRSLRNNLAHEYPERTADIIYAINSLHTSWDRFSGLYGRLIDTAEKTIQKL